MPQSLLFIFFTVLFIFTFLTESVAGSAPVHQDNKLVTESVATIAVDAGQQLKSFSEEAESLGIFDDFFQNTGASFWGWNALFHIGAIGSTILLVKTGADDKVQNFFKTENPFGQTFGDVGLAVGFFIWPMAGLGIYLTGYAKDDEELIGAGVASVQALGITLLVTTIEKVLTGRTGPADSDQANDFQFAIWDRDLVNDRRYYWPSGHTAAAFTFVAALHAYYPDEDWIGWIGYPLAAVVGISMIEGDYHWASDVVAGGLIGFVIGWTVGSNFREEYHKRFGEEESDSLSWMIFPSKTREGFQVVLAVTF